MNMNTFKQFFNPDLIVPPEIVKQAHALRVFLATNEAESVMGLGDVGPLQEQIAALRKECEQLRAALKVADALRNHERGQGRDGLESPAADRRMWRRR